MPLHEGRRPPVENVEEDDEFGTDASLLAFWSWLKPGYDAFENSKKLPNIVIEDSGKYVVK